MKRYKDPKGRIEDIVKCKVNFRFDKITNKITTKIYQLDNDEVEQEIELGFDETEDRFYDLNELKEIDLLLAFDNVWINKKGDNGIKIMIDKMVFKNMKNLLFSSGIKKIKM